MQRKLIYQTQLTRQNEHVTNIGNFTFCLTCFLFRSTRCRSIFVDQHQSNNTCNINVGGMSPWTLTHCYQRRWLLSMLNLIIIYMQRGQYNQSVSHTAAELDYHLITTTSCRKHGTFHHNSLVTRPDTDLAGPDNIKLLNLSEPVFFWSILTLRHHSVNITDWT